MKSRHINYQDIVPLSLLITLWGKVSVQFPLPEEEVESYTCTVEPACVASVHEPSSGGDLISLCGTSEGFANVRVVYWIRRTETELESREFDFKLVVEPGAEE